jgi:hypothetical protein
MRKPSAYRLLRAFSAIVVSNFFTTFFVLCVFFSSSEMMSGSSVDFAFYHFLCVFLISLPWVIWILFFEKEVAEEKKFMLFRWFRAKWKKAKDDS